MWRSSFSEDIAWSENLQFYSHPDHFHFCKENNKKKKDPGFNSLYTTAAHEPGARLRRMQVSGRDEDGQACSFSPAHTFLSISHTRSTQVGAWRAWYTLLLRKRRTNQTKMFYQRQAPKMQDLILVELLKWPVEGQINYSMGLPTVTMLWGPLRSGTSLQGLSSPGPLCSSQGLSAPGPLCSRASLLQGLCSSTVPPLSGSPHLSQPFPGPSDKVNTVSASITGWWESQELLAANQAGSHFESNSFELRHRLLMGNHGLQKWVHTGWQCQDRSFPGFLCESKSRDTGAGGSRLTAYKARMGKGGEEAWKELILKKKKKKRKKIPLSLVFFQMLLQELLDRCYQHLSNLSNM